jgi:Xaa-Pro aminopeptidase
MDYLARQKRLAAALRDARVDAMLVTHLPNIRYLCGFTGSSATLLVYAGQRGAKLTFYTDGRYTQQAADEVLGAKVVIANKSALAAAAEGVVKARIEVLGFESEQMPVSHFRYLGQSLRGKTRLKALTGTVEQLRIVKDPDEIEQIRASVLLAASLFQSAITAIRPGVPESAVAAEMEHQARRAGAEKMSFETIVASGLRSALPHGVASAAAIPANGFIILDYGVILAGYCSDMTRTVHVGQVSSAHRRMYQAVREAQLASIDAVKPGVETGEVDRKARKLLQDAGYGTYFTHSTGHGVGLEIHELPRLAKGQTQKLVPGMVITIEPGIYLPDEGGVRIEDMVLVTESGHEVLTPTPKDLLTL